MNARTRTMLFFMVIFILCGGQSHADPLSCLDNASIKYQYPTPIDALKPTLTTIVTDPHATLCASANVCYAVCINTCPPCTVMTFSITDVRCIPSTPLYILCVNDFFILANWSCWGSVMLGHVEVII